MTWCLSPNYARSHCHHCCRMISLSSGLPSPLAARVGEVIKKPDQPVANDLFLQLVIFCGLSCLHTALSSYHRFILTSSTISILTLFRAEQSQSFHCRLSSRTQMALLPSAPMAPVERRRPGSMRSLVRCFLFSERSLDSLSGSGWRRIGLLREANILWKLRWGSSDNHWFLIKRCLAQALGAQR